MANPRLVMRSFSGGELSPEMSGRIDDAKFASGLARCRNMIVRPQGPVENRAGFRYVREVKDSEKKTRLVPFVYSDTQTMVIEIGEGYFRFHTQGQTLLDDEDNPYEVENTYEADDLFAIHYVQSSDIMTLVHPDYPPMELRRYGATDWRFTEIEFTPSILPPESVFVEPYFPPSANSPYNLDDTKTDSFYVVTAIDVNGMETGQSVERSASNNLFVTGAYNTITWIPSSGAVRYLVYKKQSGLYGYIGETQGLSLVDDSISPDLSRTPPRYEDVFVVGGIASVPVVDGGAGYTTHTGGLITAVNVVSGGFGYTDPVLTVTDDTGSGATFAITVGTGTVIIEGEAFPIRNIESIAITNTGYGYTNPQYSLSGGGSGAVLSFELTTNISPPQITVTDATGTGAVLAPVIADGEIVAVTVVESGKNYTDPEITIEDVEYGGTGAVLGDAILTESGYPGAVSYYEQRRCFAGTKNKPQNIWMTRTGSDNNMSYSIPVRDDDRISFRVAAREASTVRHLVPLSNLLCLTATAEWQVASTSDAITPSSISVRPQSYIGASNVQPVVINNAMIFCAARGGHVREMGYNWQASGYITGDLSLRATHLFDYLDIIDMAYSKSPTQIIWLVSSSGSLLGLTYVPEHEIGAWHRHDTVNGVFESCAVVAEGGEDALYCVIKRTIGDTEVRFIERMESRHIADISDSFFVDCGATYEGAATQTITGLDWLEGETVSILADGAVHAQKTVTSGTVTLDEPAEIVHIGLPITADIQTLPIAMQFDDGSYGQGRAKNVNQVWLSVLRSSGVLVGPDENNLKEAKQRTTEPYGSPPRLVSDEIQVTTSPSWSKHGQMFVRQTQPLPLTILSMTSEVVVT